MVAVDFQMIGLFVSIVVGGSGAIWKLTRVETSIRAKIGDETKALEHRLSELTDRIAAVERNQLLELDGVRREVGESLAAIRAKVHEIETWARDEFVRKGSFETVISRLEKGIESLGDKLDKRLERLAEKIENISTA